MSKDFNYKFQYVRNNNAGDDLVIDIMKKLLNRSVEAINNVRDFSKNPIMIGTILYYANYIKELSNFNNDFVIRNFYYLIEALKRRGTFYSYDFLIKALFGSNVKCSFVETAGQIDFYILDLDNKLVVTDLKENTKYIKLDNKYLVMSLSRILQNKDFIKSILQVFNIYKIKVNFYYNNNLI